MLQIPLLSLSCLWLSLHGTEATKVVCSNIVTSASVWGHSAKGVSLGAYTNNQLQWIGNLDESANNFYCTDLANGITFGNPYTGIPTSADNVMRACHGVASLAACDPWGCCSAAGGMCNSPDTNASVIELCRALGYSSGSVVVVSANGCAESNFVNGVWTSDYVHSQGYGKSYTCTDPGAPISTVVPTSVPTVLPTSVPTVLPTPASISHASRAVCSDIVTTVNMWGRSAKGVALDAYTNNQLHWIGCPSSNGCSASSFFCNDLQDGIEFGSTSTTAMRSCHGLSSISDCMSYSSCCSSAGGLCNSPDTQASADELCRALGYSAGTVVTVSSNTCPETNYANGVWSSDYVSSSGFGQSYKCTGLLVAEAKCSDILTTTSVWGHPAKGVSLGAYTNNQLQWIGSLDSYTSQFYCTDLSNGITFGTTGTTSYTANRACHGVASLAACDPWGCCSAAGGMCNSPDTNASVIELCRALGYNSGSVDVVSSNSCPESNFVNGVWTSDFVNSYGYGRSYTCTGPIGFVSYNPTPVPTVLPTIVPTTLPTAVPTVVPTPSPVPQASRAVCSDIVTTVNMWGRSAKGVALDAYTNNQLHWIGCMGDGCSTSSFFCNDLQDGIEFGSTSTMRSCHGLSSISDCSSYSSCCSSAGGLCNSPDTQASADELCRALGYSTASVVAVASNGCPETNYANGVWSSDYVSSQGYGKSYKCTGLLVAEAKCSDIVTTASVWGHPAKGVSLGAYTNNQLQWIGNLDHSTSNFYCNDLSNGIRFGTTISATSSSYVMRACHGVATLADCDTYACCDFGGGVCNSPDTNVSATELCRALGYSGGYVVAVAENGCPETNYVNGIWTSDYVNSNGYGRSYTCTTQTASLPSLSPTIQATVAPTRLPTRVPTRVPTGLPTRFPTIMPTQLPTHTPTLPPTPLPTMLPTVPWAPLDGLVAYFPFNGDAIDQSGGGVQGNVHGAKLADDRHGNPDSAYEFDGIDDFIQLPHFAGMDTVENVGEVTVSWWQKILALDSAGRFSVLDTGSHTWNVGVTSQGTEMEIGAGTSIDCPSVQGVVGEWTQIAVSFDDSANIAKMYKDGVLECTLSVSGHMANTTADLYIGRDRSGSNTWATGLIDEVRIYSRMVSDMEVMLLYTDQGVFDGDDVVGDDDGDEFFGLSVSFLSAVLGVLLLILFLLLIAYCCGCIRCARKQSPGKPPPRQLEPIPLPPTVELTREVIANVPIAPPMPPSYDWDENTVASAPMAPPQYQSIVTASAVEHNSPLDDSSVMLGCEDYDVYVKESRI